MGISYNELSDRSWDRIGVCQSRSLGTTLMWSQNFVPFSLEDCVMRQVLTTTEVTDERLEQFFETWVVSRLSVQILRIMLITSVEICSSNLK